MKNSMRAQRKVYDYEMSARFASVIDAPFHIPFVDCVLYAFISSFRTKAIRYGRRQVETVEQFRQRRIHQMHSSTRTYAKHVDYLG